MLDHCISDILTGTAEKSISTQMRVHTTIVNTTTNDIPYVNRRLAWTVLWNSVIAPDLDKINLIKELLSVKFHKGQISLYCESEVDFMIWFLCTS